MGTALRQRVSQKRMGKFNVEYSRFSVYWLPVNQCLYSCIEFCYGFAANIIFSIMLLLKWNEKRYVHTILHGTRDRYTRNIGISTKTTPITHLFVEAFVKLCYLMKMCVCKQVFHGNILIFIEQCSCWNVFMKIAYQQCISTW